MKMGSPGRWSDVLASDRKSILPAFLILYAASTWLTERNRPICRVMPTRIVDQLDVVRGGCSRSHRVLLVGPWLIARLGVAGAAALSASAALLRWRVMASTSEMPALIGALIHCVPINYPAPEERNRDGIVTRISLSLRGGSRGLPSAWPVLGAGATGRLAGHARSQWFPRRRAACPAEILAADNKTMRANVP